jgi:hypothetical protein
VRRIYGDFSRSQMSGWQEKLPMLALVPHHQPANTVGKNSSDIALVIDAMDLLHSGRFDGFVLVSSRQRFHAPCLAHPRGRAWMSTGIGQQKTPEAFPQGLQAVHLCGEYLARDRARPGTQGRAQAAE